MTLAEIDSIRVLLETQIFGSTAILIGFVLVFVILLIVMAKINVFLAFIITSPAILAFSASALVPTWVTGVVWSIYAVILFFAIISVFNR